MEIWVGNRFIRGRSGGMARVGIPCDINFKYVALKNIRTANTTHSKVF